jgi:hypothetical protein
VEQSRAGCRRGRTRSRLRGTRRTGPGRCRAPARTVVCNIDERVRVPAGARAADQRACEPGPRAREPGDADPQTQMVPGRVDQPVHDQHDRDQLVDDEVDPPDARVQILRTTAEQQREHDAGDRDVERHGASGGVEGDGALGRPHQRREGKHRRCEDVGLDREEAEDVSRVEGVGRLADSELEAHRDHAGCREPEPQDPEREVSPRYRRVTPAPTATGRRPRRLGATRP